MKNIWHERKQELITILIMSVLFALTSLFLHVRKHNILGARFQIPNSYANDIQIEHYNQKGELINQLFATHMQMEAQSNQMRFDHPKGFFYSVNQSPWMITANYAFATHDFSQVVLQQNVLMQQQSGTNGAATQIATSTVTIDTQKQVATTNQPVALTQLGKNQSQTTIHTIGLKVNQKTGDIQLLSNARGYYVPPKN